MITPPISVYFEKTEATCLNDKIKSAGKVKNRLMLENPRNEQTGRVARFALSKNKIYSADEIKESCAGAYFRKQNMCNYVWVHVNATDEKDGVRDGYVRLNKNSVMKRLISLNILTKKEFRDHLKKSNDFTQFLQPLLPGKPTLERTTTPTGDEEVLRYDRVTDRLSFIEGTLTSVEKFTKEALADLKLDVGNILYIADEAKTVKEQLNALKEEVDQSTKGSSSQKPDPKNAQALKQLEEGYAAAEKRAQNIDKEIQDWLKKNSADVDNYLEKLTEELKKMPKPEKAGQPRTSEERRAVAMAATLRKVLAFTGRMTKENRRLLEGYVGAPGFIPNLRGTDFGWSCYLSTALQSLFAVPVVRDRIHRVPGDTPVKRALKELLTAWETKDNAQIGQKVADLRREMMRSGDMVVPYGEYDDADLPTKVIGNILDLNYNSKLHRKGIRRDDPLLNLQTTEDDPRLIWPDLDTSHGRSVQAAFNEQCREGRRSDDIRYFGPDRVRIDELETRIELDPTKALPPLMVLRVGNELGNYQVNLDQDNHFSASEAYTDKRAADYELVGIMEFKRYGHWVAKTRYPDGWYDCNDLGERVENLGPNLPPNTPATLLVYQLRRAGAAAAAAAV